MITTIFDFIYGPSFWSLSFTWVTFVVIPFTGLVTFVGYFVVWYIALELWTLLASEQSPEDKRDNSPKYFLNLIKGWFNTYFIKLLPRTTMISTVKSSAQKRLEEYFQSSRGDNHMTPKELASLIKWSEWVSWIRQIKLGGKVYFHSDTTQLTPSRNIKSLVKREGMPWKPLPNVRAFQVFVQPFEGLLHMFGINRRIKPNMLITPYQNQKYNRYVYIMFKKLETLRNVYDKTGKSKAYWSLAWKLMNSRIYLVICFRHIFPNWHRDMPYWKVCKILKEVSKLVEQRSTNLDYRRVYIPKGEKGYRPLGVPTEAWRVYLHAYTNLFYWYVKPHISDRQHGYQPNKGTLTAWRAIFEKINTSPDIYEFDLSNFFGSLKLGEVNNQLYGRYHFPPSEFKWLKALNLRRPKLPEERKLDESSTVLDSMNLSNKWSTDKMFNFLNNALKSETQYKIEGVPQGSPLSPILSILMLEHTILRNPNVIMYADDGVVFDKKLKLTGKEEEDMEDLNIRLNYNKSKIVKKDGKWIAPLKFLGIEVYEEGTRIRAKTRNGSEKEFDTQDAFLEYLRQHQVLFTETAMNSERRQNMEEYFASKLNNFTKELDGKNWLTLIGGASMGFWVSRLWAPAKGTKPQDFYFRYHKQSAVAKLTRSFIAKALGTRATIFNASSYCNAWLITDWTYRTRTKGLIRRIYGW